MKKGTIYLIIILLLMAGAALFLYPAFSSYLAEQSQISAVADYDNLLQQMQAEKLAEEWKKHRNTTNP